MTRDPDLPLGRFIKKRRRELRISQEKLADDMKVPRRYILRWENEGKKPSEEHLKLLAKHLKVPLADLQDPRPHEAEYRSLEDRIVALEVETFGEAQG